MPTLPEETARALFAQGFSCSQAVLTAFAERHGLARDAALRLGCAFGGGVGRTGGTCGAVSGALLVLGLAHGRTTIEDVPARERTYALARAFRERFREAHGSEVCRELLGVDIGTPEGHAAAQQAGLYRTRCPEFVASAVRIVDGLG